jgi:hypothetical protein
MGRKSERLGSSLKGGKDRYGCCKDLISTWIHYGSHGIHRACFLHVTPVPLDVRIIHSCTKLLDIWFEGCPKSWNLLLDCDTIYPLFPHAFMEIDKVYSREQRST